MPEKDRIKILGVGVDRITQKEALENVRLFLCSDTGHHIITLNSEMIVCAREDEEFRRIINSSDMCVADGMGILQAASFLERRMGKIFPDVFHLLKTSFFATFFPEKVKDVLPEKISGIDLIDTICASGFMQGRKVYLLGAREGIAKKAGEVLQEKYLHMKIVGTEEGFFSTPSLQENEELIRRINAQSPDVIFIALGAPKQEKWIHDNLAKMPSVRVAMGVGGSFDVISGRLRRAPKIAQTHGLEWLWRLMLQPRRIKRIYNATLKFTWLIFRNKEGIIGK